MENQLNNQRRIIVVQQSTSSSNGLGTAGFVLALISLLLSWLPGVNWLVWFLGFLFSFIGIFKAPRGLAIAGFILSIIDALILLLLLGWILTIAL